MRDITLEDTIYIRFTTRSFSTGAPATLSGSPVLSIYEENNLTQITAGVSVSVDYDSITGLNQATVVATAANGYENGKSYDLVITTGTAGGVSVVGEVVGSFTIGSSAAAVDLANGTDGLGAIKTDTAAILVDTGTTLQAELDAIQAAVITNAAGADIAADIIAVKAETSLIVADTNELQTDDVPGLIAALNDVAATDIVSAGAITTLAGAVVNVDLVDTTTTNTDMRGTDGANTTVPDAAGTAPTAIENRQEMDSNSTQLAAILADTNSLDGTKIPDTISLANINAEVDTALDTALPASPTAGSINDILDRQEELIVAGSAATGTLSTTTMTTDLTITVNDQYNGRIITFRKDTTTAALQGQQTDITDTVTTNGQLTFTALTTAPVNGDIFEIT